MSLSNANDAKATHLPFVERREIPNCLKCHSKRVSRLPDVPELSRLRWFQCRLCANIWPKGPRKTE